jgi:hypothetical protein
MVISSDSSLVKFSVSEVVNILQTATTTSTIINTTQFIIIISSSRYDDGTDL